MRAKKMGCFAQPFFIFQIHNPIYVGKRYMLGHSARDKLSP